MPVSLRRNFLWTLTGNVVYAGCQWGLLVVLAKLTDPATVGKFALALAITAPVFMLTSLQLRAVQATDARHEYGFGEYFSLRLLGSALGLLIVALIPPILSYPSEQSAVILAVALAKAIESISDVIYGLLQQHEQMDRIARSMMIKGILSLACMGFAVFVNRTAFSGAAALSAAWLVVLLAYDVPCACTVVSRRGFAPQWNRGRLIRLTWLALPMGLVLMLISLNANIPRYFLESMAGSAQLGIFAAIAYLMQVGGMVMNAIGNVVTPRLAKYFAQAQFPAFRILLAKLLYLGLAIGAAGVCVAYSFGRMLLAMIYRPEYASYNHVFVILMIAAAVSYIGSCMGTAVTAVRCFAGQFPINVAASLAGLLCSYLAISRMGIQGAALAAVVIALVATIGNSGLLLSRLRRAEGR